MPVAGDLVKKIYLARVANTMRLLVSTDTPLLRSIGLVRQMIDYYFSSIGGRGNPDCNVLTDVPDE